jgi:hypothetical protein
MSRLSAMAAAVMGMALADLSEHDTKMISRQRSGEGREPEPAPEPEPARKPDPSKPFTGELPPKMPVPPKRKFTKRERKAMRK